MLIKWFNSLRTPPNNKTPDYEWALKKMMYFCAFQERSLFDVQYKLKEFNLQPRINSEIIDKLIKDNYLNEERFVKEFTIGKFRINKWGKNKIIQALQIKKIPESYIQTGIREIDEDDYLDLLHQLIAKKSHEIREPNVMKKNRMLANYAISKGFEPDLVWDIINLKE